MKPAPRNLAASIHRRLLNRARERGEDANFVLQRYAAERFLYRLGVSRYRELFVLKGAMLFALWGASFYRPTRDLDFTGYGNPDAEVVLDCFREICCISFEADGMSFHAETLRAEPIRDASDYGGLRLVFAARLGRAEVRMQVDLGFGNAIEPPAIAIEYPTLLDAPPPSLLAYPQEAVVAEKLHAMVTLGERNSRFKDFYDVYVIAERFQFDGERLAHAIGATFRRRRSGIEASTPPPLAPHFYADAQRGQQWRAYLTRNSLPGATEDFAVIGELLQNFLGPVWLALAADQGFHGTWPPTGRWSRISDQ